MKKLYLTLILFLLHNAIFASQQSLCRDVQKYTTNLFIAVDVAISRRIMTDDEVMCKAAESNFPCYIQYCLKHNIGDLEFVNTEGHTPLSIAKLLNNQKVVQIIEKYLPTSPKTVAGQLSPILGQISARKKYD